MESVEDLGECEGGGKSRGVWDVGSGSRGVCVV